MRIVELLQAAGWQVSKNTVAAVMADQQLIARPQRRRRGWCRPLPQPPSTYGAPPLK
jgi:hypothetical protein